MWGIKMKLNGEIQGTEFLSAMEVYLASLRKDVVYNCDEKLKHGIEIYQQYKTEVLGIIDPALKHLRELNQKVGNSLPVDALFYRAVEKPLSLGELVNKAIKLMKRREAKLSKV